MKKQERMLCLLFVVIRMWDGMGLYSKCNAILNEVPYGQGDKCVLLRRRPGTGRVSFPLEMLT